MAANRRSARSGKAKFATPDFSQDTPFSQNDETQAAEANRAKSKKQLAQSEASRGGSTATTSDKEANAGWLFLPALVGSLLMFAAQPPWGLWPLAWVAPIPWLVLVQRVEIPRAKRYRKLYLAGWAYWLLTIHWLRLPHPLTSIGWIALSAYLAVYFPLFVAIARFAVQRARISLVVAAPVIWVGLEWARAHFLSGFAMGAIGHTQYRWTGLIQISDLVGGYGVDFLILMVAACLTLAYFNRQQSWSIRLRPLLVAVVSLAFVLGYGWYRTSGDYLQTVSKVALIQGSIPSELKHDPEHSPRVMQQYYALTQRAAREHPELDLIVWPETMFRSPLLEIAEDHRFSTPEQMQVKSQIEYADTRTREAMVSLAQQLNIPLLLGVDIAEYRDPENYDTYNSSVFVSPEGEIDGRYDKMFRVAFGEFIPLGESIPWLYDMTPLTGGIRAGTAPVSYELGGVRYSPNICYETVVPHALRTQIAQLREQGQEPDVLVNLTNDGWFHGSSELDQHLACGVFRAVEARKPLLIAANTGFSAWVDSDGHIRTQGPRLDEAVLVAEVQRDSRSSFYLMYGDWFAGFCALVTGALAFAGYRQALRVRKSGAAEKQA